MGQGKREQSGRDPVQKSKDSQYPLSRPAKFLDEGCIVRLAWEKLF
jgi:hypothetical protein